jgi:hypothetical protein
MIADFRVIEASSVPKTLDLAGAVASGHFMPFGFVVQTLDIHDLTRCEAVVGKFRCEDVAY